MGSNKGRHPKKPIRKALAGTAQHLSVTEIHRAHRWGVLVCTVCGAEFDIYSTPKDPETTAKKIRRFAETHAHKEQR